VRGLESATRGDGGTGRRAVPKPRWHVDMPMSGKAAAAALAERLGLHDVAPADLRELAERGLIRAILPATGRSTTWRTSRRSRSYGG
jgi:hypothetical protein